MFVSVSLDFLSGFLQNVLIFFVTTIIALPLSVGIALLACVRFRPVAAAAKFLIWIVRGTPLMLQLFIIFYVPGLVFDMPFQSRITAVFIAFGTNYAFYFAEIFRGAYQNIPKGQWEACKVLSLSKWQAFWHVIFLQIVRQVVAPFGNEFISLVKDTSLARVIAIPEILFLAANYTIRGLIWPLFYTGVFFLAASGAIQLLFNLLERRIKNVFGEKPV
jgi:polar amino acid transport system permease protein